jgi:putative transposase
MQRKVDFVVSEYYHVYNRGADKRKIFLSPSDYRRFIALLYLANSDEDVRIGNLFRNTSYLDIFKKERGNQLVSIGAYCLMPNHFHLLVTPLVENGLSQFMLKLQTGYSMYFNIKNDRKGALFQGPFKSEHAADDVYLKYLFSYIHLNPAKLKDSHWKENICSEQQRLLKSFVEEYPYSSLKEYLDHEHVITNPTTFPDYFTDEEELSAHITDWLELPE